MSIVRSARRLALGCAAALTLSAPAWAANHDGDWAGVLKTPNGQQLHLILHLTTAAGETKADLESVDQGGFDLPAAAVMWNGEKASILFLAIGGEMEGTFAPDGKTWTGVFTQGLSMPLTLTKTAAAPPAPAATAKR
jgi:hypothetical protein